MKKFFKVLGIIFAVFVVIIIAGLVYFNNAYPKVDPPSTEKVEITPARIARGNYLANHVTVCMDCHSTRDFSKFAGPIVPGSEGKGGDKFDKDLGGIPGVIYAKNITPYSLKNWTDGEIMRTITCGVTKNNTALFPLMPYLSYNNLSKEDLYSLVAYIRSLEPKESTIPDRSLDFPMNMIVKSIPPSSYVPKQQPDKNNVLEYGKYLTTIAACGDCHTPADKGTPLPGMDFAGGFEFKLPIGTLKSANITPDNETGIGAWTKETFIKRFKSLDSDSARNMKVPLEANTAMPWLMFAGMTEEDLGAIYDYLRTIKPVNHRIVRFTPSK